MSVTKIPPKTSAMSTKATVIGQVSRAANVATTA